ncbi:hypothetical protein EXIGLDRAFT_737461 [Exidia glandulosa HHB12029]|uniref:ATPase AAA-type core domain-containing protein n=1 Tax=Exidia glandulosa HHB12029 TaxID=1314781 RepID=A0A166MXW1_EXIGL|nr:hypothetical protein EXIGLDRAFT_737461 [Exidia glandulosa HHB12029]
MDLTPAQNLKVALLVVRPTRCSRFCSRCPAQSPSAALQGHRYQATARYPPVHPPASVTGVFFFLINGPENSPSIIFIDEIDSIVRRRTARTSVVSSRSSSGSWPRSNVRHQPSKLHRPCPSLFRHWHPRPNWPSGDPPHPQLGDDVDLEQIPADTHGYVGADLASLRSWPARTPSS